MKKHESLHRRAGRVALKLTLLMIPAVFWSIIFASLAGVRPLGPSVYTALDPARVVHIVCPALAAILGLRAIRQGTGGGLPYARRGGHTPDMSRVGVRLKHLPSRPRRAAGPCSHARHLPLKERNYL